MWMRILYLIVIYCSFLPAFAFAQDTGQSSLTWDREICLDSALKNNSQINTLRFDERISETNLLQSRAQRLPGVSASVSQSVVHSTNAHPAVGGFQTKAAYSANYGLNANWMLSQGGFVTKDIKQQGLILQSAGLSVEEAQNDV